MTAPLRTWLAPLTPIYRLGLALRESRLASGKEPVRRLHFPVVSIGNLSTGGAGKTPLTIALARSLSERGLRVDVLSRGYGRQYDAPARVRPDGTAVEFGDEPLLIARATGLPVFVAPQRYDAGLLAESDPGGAALHLLDDGFQHRQLHRDVDILLVNRADWSDRLLPAGNLREPIHVARRATVVAIPADESRLSDDLRTWGWRGPIWPIKRLMEVPPISGAVGAFCGIAHPDQFFAGLEHAGLRVAVRTAFRDHHGFTVGDLDRLRASARSAGAVALVTTEKDLVRLGRLADSFPPTLPLTTVRLRAEIEDETQAVDWLLHRLNIPLGHTAL